MYKYIFNSKSEWVAYVYDGNIFSAKSSEWIGWIDKNEVWSPGGEYLGELYKFSEPNFYMVLRKLAALPKFNQFPPFPPFPPLPPFPPFPPFPPLSPLGYIDIFSDSFYES